jgi:hypothetical protein
MILRDILENLDVKQSKLIEEPLRKLLSQLIQTYNPNQMIQENYQTETPFLKNLVVLKNYLAKTNEKMHKKIMDFIDSYGNQLNTAQYNKIQEFILSLTEFSTTDESSVFTILNFIQHSVAMMSQVYPSMILHKAENVTIPKHWGLSDFHTMDIHKFVSEALKELVPFHSDPVLQGFLYELLETTRDVNTLFQAIPFTAPFNRSGMTFFSFLDKRAMLLLSMYCWYSILYEMIQLTFDQNLIRMDIQETKKTRRRNIEEQNDPNNVLDTIAEDIDNDMDDELMNVEIKLGEQAECKTKVCNLMIKFIKIQQKHKAMIDLPYAKISRKNRKTKEAEKKSITDFFENMEKDERKIEDALKKYKMGRWNIGNQKGVFQYDKDVYDANRDATLARMYGDLENNDLEISQEEMLSIAELERMEQVDQANQHDGEGMDLTGMAQNYKDGVYYEEDADEDDFGYEE